MTVGSDKVKLSSLSVTGYENSDYLYSDGAFACSFQILQGNGAPKAQYFYRNDSDDGETWNGARWEDELGNVIDGSDDEHEVLLDVGTGIWMTVPDGYQTDGIFLVSSGGVIAGDTGIELAVGTYRAISNPLPSAIKLSQCEIQGYEDTDYLYSDGAFACSFQILQGNGAPKAQYFYRNDSDDGELWNGARWEDEFGKTIDGSDAEHEFMIEVGMGMWFTAPDAYDYPNGIFMVFPKVID